MPGFSKLSTDSAITFWDELVQSNRVPATIAHNPHFFSFYSEFLSLEPFYFVLRKKETPVGLFPVVKSGNKFISMPHFSYGGVFWLTKADKNTVAQEEFIIQFLIAEIENKKLKTGFYSIDIADLESDNFLSKSIEIRGEISFFETTFSEKTRHFVVLKNTKEEQLHFFSSNLRRKISKAEKNEILVKKGKEDLLNDFVKVYQKNMHKLGSPAFGKNFFQQLLHIRGADSSIFVAYFQNKPVGAAFCLSYFDFSENIWFSTISKYNNLYTAYLLHWKMIEDAIDQKKKIYSLGRSSTGSGVHDFKKQWQAEEKPLYFSNTVKSMFNLKDQKWLNKIWKVLPPIIVNKVGPLVAKRIY